MYSYARNPIRAQSQISVKKFECEICNDFQRHMSHGFFAQGSLPLSLAQVDVYNSVRINHTQWIAQTSSLKTYEKI
jgi:hypothetical protein